MFVYWKILTKRERVFADINWNAFIKFQPNEILVLRSSDWCTN